MAEGGEDPRGVMAPPIFLELFTKKKYNYLVLYVDRSPSSFDT